ncbi:MAG: hypothetical protein HY931_01530 [Candidatus Falkowbacteria bacterium]|nr:MAG: hypothetical protein HY931_01530 [Candidatus Falkowbacteria bacterium]
MIKDLSKKQRTELRAAVLFVKSVGLNINYNDFIFPPEADSIDVIYEPEKIKFQVISVDGGPNKLIRHSTYSWSDKLDEIVGKYVVEPITKKYKCYMGRGVSDVILLIHSVNKPGRTNELESDILNNQKEIIEISKQSGFKSVFLVFDISEQVIPIYIP